MADETKNKPSYCCDAHHKMEPAWKVVSDVSGGTLWLRNGPGCKNYLPQEPAEDIRDHGTRRDRAIFYNAFERTVHGLVGMVFRKEPKMGEDVPDAIRGTETTEGWAENIDLQGNHWAVFAKELFTDAMRDGHAFLFVDMPPALPEGATLADEMAAGRRPYWVSYKASQAINWRTEPETRLVTLSTGDTVLVPTGRQILAQITFEECSQEPDGGYGEAEVKRYRVLRPGSWTVYRKSTDERGVDTYEIESEGTSSLTEIPIAVVYGRKKGSLVSQPPLLDLALINLAHYQKYSDYSEGLRMCIPQLCTDDPDLQIAVVGHHSFHKTRMGAKVYFTEPTGAGLNPQRQDLQDLQEQMAILGLSVMASKKPSGNTTATEASIDHLQSDSELATAARSLKDACELGLRYMAQYGDPAATSGGSIELGASFEDLTLSAQEMQAYSNMVRENQLTLETFLAILARGGKLPEDTDPATEAAAAQKAAQEKADRMALDFMRGGPPV